jgi:hypothetical protein
MDKIVIVSNDPESCNHLINLLKLLFPECDISIIPEESKKNFNIKEKESTTLPSPRLKKGGPYRC